MNKIYKIPILIFLFFYSVTLQAQITVEGNVTDESGIGLPGVTILLKGTTKVTITDYNGDFTITVPDEESVLQFNYIGYAQKEVEVGSSEVIEVMLDEDVQELSEVVVTALGVERQEKSLGYSVQKIDGQSINQTKSSNFSDALQGKIAGLRISSSSNGPTASNNVIIRGETSIAGNNQALFVVNGIPISNSLITPGDGLNGSTTIDFGNDAQIVNPADVESISVLKGPAAAALYGTRASNGVILITTKTGKNTTGWGLNFTSNTTFERILRLPDYQNQYGFGGEGKFSYNNGTTYTGQYYDAFGENWGPRTDGTPIKQWDSNGVPVPYTPAEGNIRNFFRTGLSTVNTVSLSNSSEGGDFRLSYTDFFNKGIVPNTGLRRNTGFLSVGKKFFERLDVRANTMYIHGQSDNVPNAGYDESSSVMYGWLWYPRQEPIDNLRNYWKPGLEDIQQNYVEELWVNNPWFIANENTNAFQSDRLIGNLSLNLDITERLSARFRFGADVKNQGRRYKRAKSTKSVLNGSYREDDIFFTETNTEFLLSYESDDTQDFYYSLRGGFNIMRQKQFLGQTSAPNLSVPGIYTLANVNGNVLAENFEFNRGINSGFGLASFSYKNLFYVDLTGRVDESSTLPSGDNVFFYPSASISTVFTDWGPWLTGSPLSFGKIRIAYAEVGGDTNPYNLVTPYTFQVGWSDSPIATKSADIRNPNLKPERTTSMEGGIDLRFFNGKLQFDATYYIMNSMDQILRFPIAKSSGGDTFLQNGGELRNQGVEIMLGTRVFDRTSFSWDINFNLARNRTTVESLPSGISNYQVVPDLFPGDEGGQDLSFEARPGELYGQLVGLGFQRDSQGNIIHENGLPLLTTNKVSAGSYQPEFISGISNVFSYKGWRLGVLFYGQFGGKIYSRTHAMMNTGGTITNNDDPILPISTLDGRIIYDVSYDSNGEPVYDLVDAGGVVGPGVMYDQEGNLVPNDVGVSTRDYFYSYYGNGFNRDNIEAATYDATYVKLRELRLSYDVPSFITDRIGALDVQLSVVGRNLFLFTDVPSIDPETYSIRNGGIVPGFESTQLPSTSSLGFDINVRF